MAEPADTSASSAQRKASIMIVDDDSGVRFFLRNYLTAMGVSEVLEATNGQEAIEIAKERPNLALVIMDMKMPEVDGVEAVRQIRASNESIPIIVLTAYPEYEGLIETAKQGVSYVMKPIEMEQLDKIIADALSQTQNPDS